MQNDLIISICGDICSECPRYLATQSNDISELKKVSELWFRLGFRDKILDPEELKCYGCNKEKFCSHGLNRCDHLDGINNCGECLHFPCEKIHSVFEKTDEAKKICRERCSKGEYQVVKRAFLMKKKILEKIYREIF